MLRMKRPGQILWTRLGVSSEGCGHSDATTTFQGQSLLRKWETTGVHTCIVHTQWYQGLGNVGGGRSLCLLTPQEESRGAQV